jgi:HSP20 family protein
MSSMIRWQPLKEIQALRHQMDHLFGELVQNEPLSHLLAKERGSGWMPAIELQETDDSFILKAEVPGVAAEDLNIQVGSNEVDISGEHREESRTEEKGMVRSEFHYGHFRRVISLPVAVKQEEVRADFENGILALTLPKVEAHKRSVVKVDLTQKMRELNTRQRQEEALRQNSVHERAMEVLKPPNGSPIVQEAREAVIEQRQRAEHIQDTMLQRAAEQVGAVSGAS